MIQYWRTTFPHSLQTDGSRIRVALAERDLF
jgi:hypothetical protein